MVISIAGAAGSLTINDRLFETRSKHSCKSYEGCSVLYVRFIQHYYDVICSYFKCCV